MEEIKKKFLMSKRYKENLAKLRMKNNMRKFLMENCKVIYEWLLTGWLRGRQKCDWEFYLEKLKRTCRYIIYRQESPCIIKVRYKYILPNVGTYPPYIYYVIIFSG